ncbi:unnamed protein product [Caenorhabditis brenneri]
MPGKKKQSDPKELVKPDQGKEISGGKPNIPNDCSAYDYFKKYESLRFKSDTVQIDYQLHYEGTIIQK